MNESQSSPAISPFERIRRTSPAGNQFWSSLGFAWVLETRNGHPAKH